LTTKTTKSTKGQRSQSLILLSCFVVKASVENPTRRRAGSTTKTATSVKGQRNHLFVLFVSFVVKRPGEISDALAIRVDHEDHEDHEGAEKPTPHSLVVLRGEMSP
jgi:hypothetical protein